MTVNNTVLTHNHFDKDGLPLLEDSDTIFINDVLLSGQPEIVRIVRGKETTLMRTTIYSHKDGHVQLASPELISSIPQDSWVDITYWNDEANQVDITFLQVVEIQPEQGMLILTDPKHIINEGDSGGGVYYNDQLVGNLFATIPSKNEVLVALNPDFVYDTGYLQWLNAEK